MYQIINDPEDMQELLALLKNEMRYYLPRLAATLNWSRDQARDIPNNFEQILQSIELLVTGRMELMNELENIMENTLDILDSVGITSDQVAANTPIIMGRSISTLQSALDFILNTLGPYTRVPERKREAVMYGTTLMLNHLRALVSGESSADDTIRNIFIDTYKVINQLAPYLQIDGEETSAMRSSHLQNPNEA